MKAILLSEYLNSRMYVCMKILTFPHIFSPGYGSFFLLYIYSLVLGLKRHATSLNCPNYSLPYVLVPKLVKCPPTRNIHPTSKLYVRPSRPSGYHGQPVKIQSKIENISIGHLKGCNLCTFVIPTSRGKENWLAVRTLILA